MRTDLFRAAAAAALALFLAAGCSGGPDLERTQERRKVTLRGTFLTEDPDEIVFPIKVLFAIDCSLSMGDEIDGVTAGSDPQFLRLRAVEQFIAEYNGLENTAFEVMLWSANVFSATQTSPGRRGFTKDTTAIMNVIQNAQNDTVTDYLGTLDAIQTDIFNDIRANPEDVARTKYIVVFLSDGMPNGQGGPQSSDDILDSVQSIVDMTEAEGVRAFSFHTFLLTGLLGGFPDALAQAEGILEDMARVGHGQYRRFETAEAIDFLSIVDLRLTMEYEVKFLLAYNYNVLPGIELVYADSDGDGLSDEEELAREAGATDPTVPDTDGDGFGDYFEWRLSTPDHPLDPLVPDSNCDDLPGGQPDDDDDGLNNCEELVIGTLPSNPDTDSDGIPDGIEFRAGTNPLEAQEAGDLDFDGLQDKFEVQRHTNATSNDPKVRDRYAYAYDVRNGGLVETTDQGEGLRSYVRRWDFTISNIDIMDTLSYTPDGQTYRPAGENRIRLFFSQVPMDDRDAIPTVRMAEVIVNMADESRECVLNPGDFQLLFAD